MKYAKMLGLLAIAAAAFMAFAGPASAKLTEGTGDPVEAGEVIHASAEGTTSLDGVVDIACAKSTVGGTVNAAGGTTGTVTTLTFEECNKDTVKVITKGSLEIKSSGEVQSTGAEVTVTLHRTVLGFPVTTHCTYKTNATKVGTLTESDRDALGPHTAATMDINGSKIPVVDATSDDPCGPEAEWTGNYLVTTPAFLAVD